jgi:glycine C-acetyltransferase
LFRDAFLPRGQAITNLVGAQYYRNVRVSACGECAAEIMSFRTDPHTGCASVSQIFIASELRQRSRPYLFSNTVAPPVVAGALKAIDLVSESPDLRDRLNRNAAVFREGLGFELLPGEHPIVPIMLHDATKATKFAQAMLEQGVYVAAFSFPVVPHGKAHIRTQMSAALSDDDISLARESFRIVRDSL